MKKLFLLIITLISVKSFTQQCESSLTDMETGQVYEFRLEDQVSLSGEGLLKNYRLGTGGCNVSNIYTRITANGNNFVENIVRVQYGNGILQMEVAENCGSELCFTLDIESRVAIDESILVGRFDFCIQPNPNMTNWYVDSDGDGFGDYDSDFTCVPANLVLTDENMTAYRLFGKVTNNLDTCPNEFSYSNNGCLDAVKENINYTRSQIYDINGKVIGASKSYFNSIGKGIQTQSYDLNKKKVWATETRYDSVGRPVLNTLAAPITNQLNEVSFGYNDSFIMKQDNSPFTISDYGNDLTDPAVVGTQNLTLGNYYSSLNTDEILRDITDRPYSKMIYSDLVPGSVKQIIGGNKINGEWKQGYNFTMPAVQEPYYVLGFNSFETNPEIATTYNNITDILNETDKQIMWLKATKSVIQDVHGIEAVVFTDADGKTIGAARSGGAKQYEVLSLIGEQNFVDIHIPIGCENTASFLTTASDYRIYDLKTEKIVAATELQNAGFYRIEYIGTKLFTKASNLTYIDKGVTNTIHPVEDDAVGVRYKVNYYDFSLNEYDDVGRLTKSLQPLGFNDSCLDNLSATVTHNENLKTTYTYNVLGQLVSTTSPDEGTANFKYRNDGQIRFSQNSKQAANGEFSYTNYDELARPVESGVFKETTSIKFETSDNLLENVLLDITIDDDGLSNQYCKEQHFSKYDFLADNIELKTIKDKDDSSKEPYANPSFLSGNVAKTFNLDNSGNEISATYYSYDVHGRVKWIVQKVQGTVGELYITIDYEYDPITGQVIKVIFQKNKPGELFVHRYSYDLDANKLIKVETSIDNSTFITHAEYDYYESGSLKRTTLAEGIQDIDYVYNLAGQLKAINHPSLATDPEINPNGTDLFGLSLDYYTNDYKRDAKFIEYSTGEDRYNGNIKSMTWNTDVLQNGESSPLQYSYEYNKNNWLTAATFSSTSNNLPISLELYELVTTSTHKKAANNIVLKDGFSVTASNSLTFEAKVTGSSTEFGENDYNVSNIKYDANGNIERLHRNKNTENGTNRMDELSYTYRQDKPNQLDHVTDAAGNAGVNDIDSQNSGNYVYNEIGQLIEDFENVSLADKQMYINNPSQIPDNLIRYVYNASGLVTEINKGQKLFVRFIYNDKNFRTKKISYQDDGITPEQITDYIRDASGQVLAIYENGDLKELPIYGTGRLGIYNKSTNTSVYQLTDHLGNVRAVIAKQDVNVAALTSTTDYYPFGMPMPNRDFLFKTMDNGKRYRYAYQGQEVDPETGKEAFQLRLWDARIGRWLTTDPAKQYSSPYLGMGNNPMNGIDPDGGKFFTDFIIKETGQRHKVNDGIEQVVAISQNDYNSLMKSWESFDIGYYYAQLSEFTPLSLSVGDFDAIAGTLFAEGSTQMPWQEAAGIYSVLENRANADRTDVLGVISGGGVYGYDDRNNINSIYANQAKVNNAYKGLIEGYYGNDFSNGAYYWHGNDFYRKVTWSKAHERFYLSGFKFTDSAHDIWNIGNHKTKHSWIYKYQSTNAIGETTFMRLTNSWMNAAGRNTRWNGKQR